MSLRPEAISENYRPGVGIMLLNGRGKVFVARRNDMAAEAWQMPQGGIEGGEDPRCAALRELREEIGTDNAEFVEESRQWHWYDFPEGVRQRARHGRWLGQCQKWFVMRYKGEDEEINLATEHPEFVAWKWAEPQELPGLAVSFKRRVYYDLLAEFGDITQGAESRILQILRDPVVRLVMAADNVDEEAMFDLLYRASANLRRHRSS